MKTAARVNIWNRSAGAVVWDDESGYAAFEFDNDFLKLGLDIAPLMMPVNEAIQGNNIYSFRGLNRETYRGLPGLLSDSLPDKFGEGLIRVWLARQGRDSQSFNPVERLCYTGKRGMGALEYEPPVFNDNNSHPFEIEEMVKLVKDALAVKENLSTNIHDKKYKGLMEIIRVGTSAGGARAKAVIAYNEKTGAVRSGQIDNLKGYEYWIIKFDGINNEELGDPKGYCKIEYAYYLMALECGINMSLCRLLHEEKRVHFMTKRFDRNGINKIHMQSLCAIAHYDYNDPMGYSYEQAFEVIRKLKLPYTDSEELYRRMVFNVITRNQDDHTKNISFLMDENGKWSLSPAYDLTFAHDPVNKWMHSHQMSINEKRDNITSSDLKEVAKRMNIKRSGEITEKIKDVVSGWGSFAKEAELDNNTIKNIQKALSLNI